MKPEEIIVHLRQIATQLDEEPLPALADLRTVSAKIDGSAPYRDGHLRRVSRYSERIGRKMGLGAKKLAMLEVAALLHDIGKIGIDENILMKPDALSDRERAEIETHALKGYFMLHCFAEISEAVEGIRSHHEKFDGSGYPDGISNEEIPLIARIIAVADAFDAMTSKRPYRPTKTKAEALDELKTCAGTHFDPAIVSVFAALLGEDGNLDAADGPHTEPSAIYGARNTT